MVQKIYKIANLEIIGEITFKKVKYLRMRVRNGKLLLSIPFKTPMGRIDSFVYKYQDYILNRLKVDKEKEEKANIKEHQIIKIMDKEFEILFAHKNFICNDKIYIDVNNKETIKDILMELFKNDLLKYLTNLTHICYLRLNTSIPCPEVKLRKMKRVLGDYTRNKNLIKYTTNLIFRPVESYESLVCHELAHMLVHNHGKDFYEVVYRICPNYKYLHKRLKEVSL